MMEYFTLNLKKGAEVLNGIKIEKQGFNLTKLVGAQGKHAMQSCKVQVRGKDVIDFLIKAKGYVFAKVFDGAECIYEGVIKPYITVNANTSSAESISLDIMDYTELLDKRVFNDITSIGVTTNEDVIIARSWKNQSVRAILTALFALCGIDQHVNIEFESAPGLDITFVDFRIVDGDNIHNVIDSLCYESLIDYRFDVGKVVIYDTEGNTPLADIDDYRQSAKISRTKEYDNGVKLTWQNTYTERCEIYHESNRWDEEVWHNFKIYWGGTEWHTGYYYNRDMHDYKPTGKTAQWSFKNITDKVGEIVVLNVSNATITPKLHDERDVSIEAHLDSYDDNGGVAYIWYDGRFNYIFGKGWGFEYSVYADVLYRKPYEVSLQRGLKPKSVKLKYLDTRKLAAHFGEVYMQKQAQSCYKYDFSSNQQLIPGKCYRFHENRALGVSSIVRIISATYDHEKKIYRYKAEGANTIEVEPLEMLPPASSETIPQDMPAEEVDFFYLTADRTFFLKEETSDKATVTAHGVALRLATSIDWIFKGSNLGVHGDSVVIPVLDLAMGSNNLTCRVIIDSVPYERNVSILKTQVNDNALIQYRYGSDPKEPPYTEGGVWFWNNKAMFLGGKLIGNPDSENWIEGIPGKTEHAPYLWMRISTDGGATWTYTRLHADDDISFKIAADSTVYPMSARGATVAPTTLHLKAEKKNTTGVVTWTSMPEIFAPKTGDAIECIIPSGCQEKKIVITASITGIRKERIALTSYETGTVIPCYVGEYTSLEELNAVAQNPYGFPWIEGDHAVIINRRAKDNGDIVYDPMPYVYHQDTPHWRVISTNDESYGLVWSNTVADILKRPNLDLTCAAQYGIFENLAAVSAFVDKLFANYIKVQKAVYGGGYSKEGVPLGSKGFHLSSDGQLQAAGAILTGKFSCSVMETVLEAIKDGKISAHLAEGEGVKFKGNEVQKQVFSDILPPLKAYNDTPQGYFCQIYDGVREYTRVVFTKYTTSKTLGVYYAALANGTIETRTVHWTERPQDEFHIDTNERGDTWYDPKFANMHFNQAKRDMVITRFQYIGDFGYSDTGERVIPFTGTVRIKGNAPSDDPYVAPLSNIKEYACTATSSNIHYFKIKNDIFYVYDSSMNQVCSFREILSCDIEIEFSTGVLGLRTQSVFPFDSVNNYSIGLPNGRFAKGYFNKIDALHANFSALPTSSAGLNSGDLYIENGFVKIV